MQTFSFVMTPERSSEYAELYHLSAGNYECVSMCAHDIIP